MVSHAVNSHVQTKKVMHKAAQQSKQAQPRFRSRTEAIQAGLNVCIKTHVL